MSDGEVIHTVQLPVWDAKVKLPPLSNNQDATCSASVLCHPLVNGGEWHVGWYDYELKLWWWDEDGGRSAEVSHWMPLPPRPDR